MRKKVTKAVFPVAGLGTRFLPVTKANPKEMLPIIDKPLIQYAVEEAVAAGITELIFITSSNKRAIEDHFDRNIELEHRLAKTSKVELLKTVENILPKGVNCVYIRQSAQLGLGHAIACAESLINNEPFAVLLADDLIDNTSCLTEMIAAFAEYQTAIIAVSDIADEETEQYGVVALQNNDLQQPLKNIVEKPKTKDAPSRLGVVGRYILPSQIFKYLAKGTTGIDGEIQLTDALAALLAEQAIYAHKIKGKRYDCGSKLGYLKATVAFALNHTEVGAAFQAYLTSITD